MKSDVLIVGGGPAGSTSAMFLLEEGIKPLIVEAEDFPRYHIGESMTGAAGQVLRELGYESEMYRLDHPTKKGVQVFGKSKRGTWFVPVMGRDENWELFEWDTWQVRRSDFDTMMLDAAVDRGATLMRGKATSPVVGDDGVVRGARIRMADGGEQVVESDVLLDCSGQATWLANKGGVTGPKYSGSYDKQIAIFSQVRGAVRGDNKSRETDADNTLIFYKSKFHWAWFIPLDDEVVSVGVVIPSAYFTEKKESKTEFFLRELKELHTELAARVPSPELVEDVHVIPNYSYQVKGFCGKGFMCIGDSHRFIDPIFSFGLTAAMREAQFAAPRIREYLEGKGRDADNPFAEHQLVCEKGIDALEDLVDMFWEQPFAFALFVHQRYRDQMIDMFAGRMYGEDGHQPSRGLLAFRKLLGRVEEREQSYESEDLYSVPIGSRFHPERAALWNDESAVPGTEEWVGAE